MLKMLKESAEEKKRLRIYLFPYVNLTPVSFRMSRECQVKKERKERPDCRAHRYYFDFFSPLLSVQSFTKKKDRSFWSQLWSWLWTVSILRTSSLCLLTFGPHLRVLLTLPWVNPGGGRLLSFQWISSGFRVLSQESVTLMVSGLFGGLDLFRGSWVRGGWFPRLWHLSVLAV